MSCWMRYHGRRGPPSVQRTLRAIFAESPAPPAASLEWYKMIHVNWFPRNSTTIIIITVSRKVKWSCLCGMSPYPFSSFHSFILFLFFFQDILSRVKTILVDEKMHLRFGDWTTADVSFTSFLRESTRRWVVLSIRATCGKPWLFFEWIIKPIVRYERIRDVSRTH